MEARAILNGPMIFERQNEATSRKPFKSRLPSWSEMKHEQVRNVNRFDLPFPTWKTNLSTPHGTCGGSCASAGHWGHCSTDAGGSAGARFLFARTMLGLFFLLWIWIYNVT